MANYYICNFIGENTMRNNGIVSRFCMYVRGTLVGRWYKAEEQVKKVN